MAVSRFVRPRSLQEIEAYVRANKECSEDDVANAFGIPIKDTKGCYTRGFFDLLEDLNRLERQGRLRSEPIEPSASP